ncbi:sigma-54-dependent transcriptional regulator [Fusobacterium sp. MFO224]|uniref:sigma-54-dependent transcriptional regulator n=1 Tax=Fusobacterium sp. MFO224 TaxID=3378070 RepID=UPI0038535971
MNKKVMIIDDEISICDSLEFALEDKYNVSFTTNPYEGLEKIKENNIDIVLLDLKIGDVNGLDILEKIKEYDKNISVIMMTAYGSIVSSVDAIKKGAFTYLTKPLNLEELYISIEQALEIQNLNKKVEYLSKELEDKNNYQGIIGKSETMKNIFSLVEKLKDVDLGVMITGESGTGKELVAKAIHYSGKRKNENFVEINCAAIPESLLEEEFFGHKKGTFTNAISDKVGKFEFANNGTIFLDEIGDMSLKLQGKLLRVLQEQKFNPLGSNETIEIDVRVIAATNKDLKKLIEEEKFREDLYFRLNVVEIDLPPLREKKTDLPLLFDYFIKKCNKEMNRNIRGISKDAEKILLNYDYPGNVRELLNIMEYSVLLSQGDLIDENSLPKRLKNIKSSENKLDEEVKTLDNLTLKEIEKIIIKKRLKNYNGKKKNTAESLGISDKGLRNKIAEYEL